MLSFLFKLLSIFPLPFIHQAGKGLGILLNKLNHKAAQNRYDNLIQSDISPDKSHLKALIKTNITEIGKAILETPYIWNKNNNEVAVLVKQVHNWHHIDDALATGKGIIFLTPHLGCFEITSLYYALHHPITVLYRPPKKRWLLPLINSGRSRDNIVLAEANASGVRKLMQTLKQGNAIGILPDQNPRKGEGEWANFFGKPAYTMTLASKLAEKTGATVIMAFGERLAKGKGFAIHLTKLKDHAIATPVLLNKAIETQIKLCPSQYLWSYHRYKASRKSKPMLNKK